MSVLVTRKKLKTQDRVHTISDIRWMTQQAGHGEIGERRSNLAHKPSSAMA